MSAATLYVKDHTFPPWTPSMCTDPTTTIYSTNTTVLLLLKHTRACVYLEIRQPEEEQQHQQQQPQPQHLATVYTGAAGSAGGVFLASGVVNK